MQFDGSSFGGLRFIKLIATEKDNSNSNLNSNIKNKRAKEILLVEPTFLTQPKLNPNLTTVLYS